MMQRTERLVWNQRCGKEAMHGLYWMSSGSRQFSVGTNYRIFIGPSSLRVFHKSCAHNNKKSDHQIVKLPNLTTLPIQ